MNGRFKLIFPLRFKPFLLLLAWFGSGCSLMDDGVSSKDSKLGLIATPAHYYSTTKARYLGAKYKDNLDRLIERIVRNSTTSQLQFANNISSVGGIGFFTHSATKSPDERYLEVVLGTPETFESKGEYSEKVNQLFSRYGQDLLAILAGDSQILQDKELAGYGLNFTWRNVVSEAPGEANRVSLARAIIYFDKERVSKYLRRDMSENELLRDAVIFAVEDNGPLNLVSYQPRERKPDFRPAIREDNLAVANLGSVPSPPVSKEPIKDPISKSEPKSETARKAVPVVVEKQSPRATTQPVEVAQRPEVAAKPDVEQQKKSAETTPKQDIAAKKSPPTQRDDSGAATVALAKPSDTSVTPQFEAKPAPAIKQPVRDSGPTVIPPARKMERESKPATETPSLPALASKPDDENTKLEAAEVSQKPEIIPAAPKAQLPAPARSAEPKVAPPIPQVGRPENSSTATNPILVVPSAPAPPPPATVQKREFNAATTPNEARSKEASPAVPPVIKAEAASSVNPEKSSRADSPGPEAVPSVKKLVPEATPVADTPSATALAAKPVSERPIAKAPEVTPKREIIAPPAPSAKLTAPAAPPPERLTAPLPSAVKSEKSEPSIKPVPPVVAPVAPPEADTMKKSADAIPAVANDKVQEPIRPRPDAVAVQPRAKDQALVETKSAEIIVEKEIKKSPELEKTKPTERSAPPAAPVRPAVEKQSVVPSIAESEKREPVIESVLPPVPPMARNTEAVKKTAEASPQDLAEAGDKPRDSAHSRPDVVVAQPRVKETSPAVTAAPETAEKEDPEIKQAKDVPMAPSAAANAPAKPETPRPPEVKSAAAKPVRPDPEPMVAAKPAAPTIAPNGLVGEAQPASKSSQTPISEPVPEIAETKPAPEQLASLKKPEEPKFDRKPLMRPLPRALEGFIIQLAFNDKNKARSWAEKMEQRGYAVSVTEAGAEGALRVRLGNFSIRDDAERQLQDFKKEGMRGIIINLPQAFRPEARSSLP